MEEQVDLLRLIIYLARAEDQAIMEKYDVGTDSEDYSDEETSASSVRRPPTSNHVYNHVYLLLEFAKRVRLDLTAAGLLN